MGPEIQKPAKGEDERSENGELLAASLPPITQSGASGAEEAAKPMTERLRELMAAIDLERSAPLTPFPQGGAPAKSNDNVKTPSDRFHELIAGISDERIAALAARLADPDDPGHTREVKWRDDPDPFGMDWAWLQPGTEDAPEDGEE